MAMKKPRKSKALSRRYRLRINDPVKDQLRSAPGHVRQQLHRAVESLSENPRPPDSRAMTPPPGTTIELRRIRMSNWRIVYLIDEIGSAVGVLTIRRRPPYDYADLSMLIQQLDE